MASSTSVRLACAAIAVILPALFISRKLRPQGKNNRIKTTDERVLILGASSGVGYAIAKRYAARGARVCVVARRPDAISALAAECGDECIGAVADFTKVDDMVRLREQLLAEWGGLDTIQLCAGVSALRPIMELTGDQPAGVDSPASGIQTAVDIAGRAVKGNFFGPLVAALTFVRSYAL
jgi:NAD(P)-dependent dehydrogenase (short-subunit alcohol dehydrogenase family)